MATIKQHGASNGGASNLYSVIFTIQRQVYHIQGTLSYCRAQCALHGVRYQES